MDDFAKMMTNSKYAANEVGTEPAIYESLIESLDSMRHGADMPSD